MTIDDLCDVIRKRRKRTGQAWVIADDHLRECDICGHCPLTAACAEESGLEYDVSDYADAAKELDLPNSIDVVKAADGDFIRLGNAPRLAAIRAKLEAACCGPLE